MLHDFLLWLSGGEKQYPRLSFCLHDDPVMIALVSVLSLGVVLGCVCISWRWYRLKIRNLSSPRTVMIFSELHFVLLLLSFTGYMFVPIRLFWPAWRLWLVMVLFLNIVVWRYVLFSSHGLGLVSQEVETAKEIELLRTTGTLDLRGQVEELHQMVQENQERLKGKELG